MTKIELDNFRVSKYQEFKNNLETVKEFFRHGDILIKQVNNTLQEIQTLINNTQETSFTETDFDDMLSLRNEVLLPIFQNASFAQEFTKYSENPIPLSPVITSETSYSTNDDSLLGITITVKTDGVITKVTTLTYIEGILSSSKVVEGNTITTSKYESNILVSKDIITKENNTLEITNNRYDNTGIISSTYVKYVDGLLITE